MTAITKSKTNQSTEVKDEKKKMIEDIRKHLNKYENIKNSKDFTVRQKDILSLMLFRGNGQDEGFTMGYKHIAETFGYSSTAISAAISLFKDYNFISVEKGHTGTNSKYTLNYEAMKNFKSSSTVSDSEIREAKSEKRSKIREEKTYDTVIQLLTRLLSDLQIREEKRRETEKRYNAENQALIRLLSDKFDTVIDLMNQRLNINNNINKNLKDNISSNNNTEEYNFKDQEKKKNISTVNLEKLKENLNNENNIPSDEKDNSKVESSKNENLNESRIPSDEGNISDNENPNDMPPLDVDVFFENNSNSTEYRTNENLNETSRDENSKVNENPEDDEIDCSVFGDSNSTDEDKDKDNDKWYESSRSSKSDNHANGMFTNLISELTSNNPKANEIPNDNNSKTSENMKNTKISANTIPSEGKNPSDENPKTNENLNAFGKLQLFRDMNTGRIDGYQFNSYDNLNDSRDYSKSFHASVLCLNLEPSDLKKVSVSDTGVWGILNRTNGVYSFIPSNVGQSYSSNNALQGDETSKVDNHTTDKEKTAENSVKMRPEPSDDNNDTASDNKNDEKTKKTQSEDIPKTEIPSDDNDTPNNAPQATKNVEVDNYTTDTEITAGNSVKMCPEASDSNTNTTDTPNNAPQAPKTSEVDSNTTNTEKVDSTQSQHTNKQSNHNTDVCYDMYGISTDELNDIIGHHHGNGKGDWRNMKIKLHNEETTISKALDHFKDKKKDGKEFMECNTFFYYFDPICFEVDRLHNSKQMTDEQFKDCCDIICRLTRGKTNYWHNTFSHRSPRPNFPSEKRMWELVGRPKVVNTDDKKSEVDNYTTSASKVDESSVKMRNTASYDNVVLPTHDDFKNMSLDNIHTKLLSFVNEHKNVSEKDKAYINNLCIAYALEPQYVA